MASDKMLTNWMRHGVLLLNFNENIVAMLKINEALNTADNTKDINKEESP